MNKIQSSAKASKRIKGVCIVGAVFLLLLVVYVGTAVPLSAWLFYHRPGGVPEWLDRAYLPLHWLRDHNGLAERFFAWQSSRVTVPAERRSERVNPGTGTSIPHDPNEDLEARVKAIERYMTAPEPPLGGKEPTGK